MKSPKKYLDEELASLDYHDEVKKQRREPDCYLVFQSIDGAVIGPPLEIYGTRKGLYKRFPKLVKKVDERYGIEVCAWWFDD